ncbi:UNVERIFIED_CONTAM: hypothetical protein GTU68_026395 [Idotea baltica]|nr:hypothetical protein [Idotea baltica]
MKLPKIQKVVISQGIGKLLQDKKYQKECFTFLEKICGQRPLVTYAKKSIAGFKLRQGWPVGFKVTLRRERMYFFIEKFIYAILPKIRNFRGLKTQSFDNNYNYNVGLKDINVFPELITEYKTLNGLNINFVIVSQSKSHADLLLSFLNFPFLK